MRHYILVPVLLLLLFCPLAVRWVPSEPHVCTKLLTRGTDPRPAPRDLAREEPEYIER